MRKIVRRSLLLVVLAFAAIGQQLDLNDYLRVLKIAPGTSVAEKMQGLDRLGITLSQRGLREMSTTSTKSAPATIAPYPTFGPPQLRSSDGQGKSLGNLNSNPYDPNSVSNPYGQYGSPYSPNSVNNPYGQYGSPYSPSSARNPFSFGQPGLPALPALPSMPALPRLPVMPSLPLLPVLPRN
jgi:hypothetical protein